MLFQSNLCFWAHLYFRYALQVSSDFFFPKFVWNEIKSVRNLKFRKFLQDMYLLCIHGKRRKLWPHTRTLQQ